MKLLIQLTILSLACLCGSTAFANVPGDAPPSSPTPTPDHSTGQVAPSLVATIPFRRYTRKGVSELRDYVPDEDMAGISVSAQDSEAGSPKEGDMIARNPANHKDQWLVAKRYFEDSLEPAANKAERSEDIPLANDPDDWEPITRGTRALQIPRVGCLVQTWHGVVFVPGIKVADGKLVNSH